MKQIINVLKKPVVWIIGLIVCLVVGLITGIIKHAIKK